MKKYAAAAATDVSSKVLFMSSKCGAAMSQTLCWPEDKGGQVTVSVSAFSDLGGNLFKLCTGFKRKG